jgi:hypothetical protein
MGIYRQRTFAGFDPSKPLVAGRQMQLLEHELQGGDPIPEDVEEGIRRRLWMVEHVHYAEDWTPTPELPAKEGELGADANPDGWMVEADGVSATAGENGWYTLHASWLGEDGENVHGAEAAQARATELREAGDTKGVTYAHTGGGWYAVEAPWLDEPLKVKGEEAAIEKAEELRAQAPAPDAEDGPKGDEDQSEEAVNQE